MHFSLSVESKVREKKQKQKKNKNKIKPFTDYLSQQRETEPMNE